MAKIRRRSYLDERNVLFPTRASAIESEMVSIVKYRSLSYRDERPQLDDGWGEYSRWVYDVLVDTHTVYPRKRQVRRRARNE